MLLAREAFSRIHGTQLSPELKKRITERRFSTDVPPTAGLHGGTATAASSSIATVEVEIVSNT